MGVFQTFWLKIDNRGAFVQDLTWKIKFGQMRIWVYTGFEFDVIWIIYFCEKGMKL